MSTKAAEKPKTDPDAPKTDAPPAPPRKTLLDLVETGVQHKPPRLFLYGVHGIGKSTFAAAAPSAIFIPTEDGASEIEVAKFPPVASQGEVLECLRALYVEKHPYQTVVLDSADWLEDFIHRELKLSYSDKELSYGKDSLRAAEAMAEVLTALNHLREKRGMGCIIIAHSQTKRFDSPMTEPYDRYQPKLQAQFGALLQEWADAVLFASYDVNVVKEEVGFNKEVRRGISSGERKLWTEERPAFIAKNRYTLPAELPLQWEKVAERIPFYSQQQ